MRIFQRAGWGTVRRGGLRRAIGTPTVVAGLIGAVGLAVWLGALAGPVSAGVSVTCTWSGLTGANWSVGSNWTGSSCTSAGGPPAGAAIIFPLTGTSMSVIYDSGTETGGGGATATSFDSITFEGQYTISEGTGAPASITLRPTAATPCSASITTIGLCDSYISAAVGFDPGVTLGTSGEEIASSASAVLWVQGAISGSGDSLVVGDPTNAGSVVLDPGVTSCPSSNTYTGSTTVGGGYLYLVCPYSVPSGTTVTVNSGAVLLPELDAIGTITNNIIDNGTVDAPAGAGFPQTLSGNISGSGTFDTNMASGTTVLSGTNSYSGTTTVNAGTLADGTANAVPTTGTLTVDSGATFDMAGFSQSVAGFSGAGTVLDSASSTTSTLTDTAGATTFSGVLENNSGTGGTVALTVSGANLALSGTNTYSGATTVSSGTLKTTSSSGFGTSTVSVAAGATLELSGGRVQPANTLDLTGTLEDVSGNDGWNGPIVLAASASPQIANPGGGGGDFVVVGAITGGAGSTLTFSATGS
ncbi:MAG: autotransporter-associated beta strand repeat-containing protein, partial [Candidatus Dormibacteria bacterium]